MPLRATSLLFTALLLLSPLAPATADDQGEANRLFLEAVALIDEAAASSDPAATADAYAGALERLERIVAEFHGSDLAVDLTVDEHVGPISLPLLRAAAILAAARAAAGEGASVADLARARSALDEERARMTELLQQNAALQSRVYALQQDENAAVSQDAAARIAELEAALADERGRVASLGAQLSEAEAALAAAAAGGSATTAVAAPEAGSEETTASAVEEGEETLTPEDITNAIKEVLRLGTSRVVERVGQVDGFNADPDIHIPLPDNLRPVHDALTAVGMGGMTEDLELRINRAAETAAPQAEPLFAEAIAQMTVDDINAIFRGPDDAATSYFRDAMSAPLREAMRPIVEDSLAQAGAVQAYEAMMSQYRSIPLVPDVKADLTEHTLDYAMRGLFHYLALEEGGIRNDAQKRTTELLQRAFAEQGG